MELDDDLFKDILDCNLEGLLNHDLYTKNLPRPIELYLKVLINFLKGDAKEVSFFVQEIKTIFESDKNNKWVEGIYHCSSLRLRLRQDDLDPEELKEMEGFSFPEPWNFEFELILGLSYLRLNLFEKSAHFFFKSHENFSSYGCHKKALICYHNHLVSRMNLDPDKNYLAEYSFIVKIARKEKVTSIEGGALVNLSRQYQLMGGLYPALEAVNEALEALNESIGTYQYYTALFQKCDLLLELGRNQEALEIYQKAKFCPIKELHSSLDILAARMNPDRTLSSIPLPESLPWKERLLEMKTGAKRKTMGLLVQQLIAELEKGPLDKHSLIEKLYPESIDFEVKENRFKVLLSKVRKQYPGLVNKDGRLYKLEMANKWLKKKTS